MNKTSNEKHQVGKKRTDLPTDAAKGLDVNINRLRGKHDAGEPCDSKSSNSQWFEKRNKVKSRIPNINKYIHWRSSPVQVEKKAIGGARRELEKFTDGAMDDVESRAWKYIT